MGALTGLSGLTGIGGIAGRQDALFLNEDNGDRLNQDGGTRLLQEMIGYVQFRGDSITRGYYPQNGTPVVPFPAAVVSGIQGLAWSNLAVNGSCINPAQANSLPNRYAAEYALRQPGVRNIIVVWIGANDAYLPDSAATIFANLKAYCQQLRAAGYIVIVCTVTLASNPAIAAVLSAYNDLIRGDSSFYDFLADVQADSTIGPAAAMSLSALSADGLHLTTLAHTFAAAIIKTQVQLALAA